MRVQVEHVRFEIPEMGYMSFDHKFDGFGVPCDRCGAENAGNRLSGDMPPGIPGTYCDKCHKIVCRKARKYYEQQLKESTKNLKTTVLYRQGGKWSAEEVTCLYRLDGGVWTHSNYPEYLILEGHHAPKVISDALPAGITYTVTLVTGTNKKRLPFLPF